MDLAALQAAAAEVRLAGGGSAERRGVFLRREWAGTLCRATLTNEGKTPVRVEEVVLCGGPHSLPPATPFYGEGYQMLSQTAGTLGEALAGAADLTKYTDRGHYKLPQPAGALTVYNLALLTPRPVEHLLLCFTSCRRFGGVFRFWPDRYEVALDTEGLTLGPGESWPLEELLCAAGADRDALLAEAGAAIERHHPHLRWPAPPTGWCSWYFYGPRVSEADILANLAAIKARGADLRYIQIDDGYQAHMGDWLVPGDRFPSGLAPLCHKIRDAGFEPAIWLAPFCAERDAQVVRDHSEWFVQGGNGAPLLSSEVSFGGWRNGPWYMLDGTHPGAQAYLEHVCRTIREQWGCRYFKLDALMWGAMPAGPDGRRFDRDATRVEAYRRGLAAIRRGAGEDSFILGCNAPLWPSLGEVHGMRVSGDVSRSWSQLSLVARETFWRTWQHGRLWIDDPDCVVLANADRGRGMSTVTEGEFAFHAAAALASGGMVLAGDDMTALPAEKWAVLRQLLPPSGVPARFEDTTWQIGWIDRPDGRLLCLFNWDDAPAGREIAVEAPAVVTDYWTGAGLDIAGGKLRVCLPPHSAHVLRVVADR